MRRGSKVICTDDNFPKEVVSFYQFLPVKDQVYQVRDVGIGVNWKGEAGEVVIYLEGLLNPASNHPPHPERGFNQERFREIEPPAWAEIEEDVPVEEMVS